MEREEQQTTSCALSCFEALPVDFFLVPPRPPELTDLPLRPSLLSLPASMSCS